MSGSDVILLPTDMVEKTKMPSASPIEYAISSAVTDCGLSGQKLVNLPEHLANPDVVMKRHDRKRCAKKQMQQTKTILHTCQKPG